MKLLLPMLLLFSSCWARAEVAVEAVADDYLQVQAQFVTAAPPELVREVLSDYDHLAQFIPDMHSSRVVSLPGQPLQVEQQGSATFLLFSFPLIVVLQIDDSLPGELAFHAVSGNLHDMHGSYRLEALAEGTRLRYQARFRPDFAVPPFISRAIMRREIERQFDGLLREIGRRQQALHPDPKPHTK